MNLEKLKDTARKFEQKEDWRRAIEVYLKAIQQIETGQETSPDLSLYNRVGDLYLKTNDTAAAVRSYERAVDLYADQGFFNNAIALCGKILRVNPGRTQTYLKLAQLHARKNVVIEAKRNLIEFLERMNALGQLDSGLRVGQGVRRPVLRQSGDPADAGRAAARLLARGRGAGAAGEAGRRDRGPGRPSAPAPRRGAAADAGRRGSAGPAVTAAAGGPRLPRHRHGFRRAGERGRRGRNAGADAAGRSDAVRADLEEDTESLVEVVPGLEQTTELELEVTGLDSDLDLERVDAGDIEFIGETIDGGDETEAPVDDALLDATADDLIVSPPGETIDESEAGGLVDLDLMEPELDETVAEGAEPAGPLGDLPLLPVEPAGEPSVVELESLILDDPDNPDLHLRLADRLLSGGEEARGLEELELALAGFERIGEWSRAGQVAERLTTLAQDVIRHHQKRVELAFRTGERTPLLGAYLALGDALARAGASDKAMAVFGRVEEHDPGNPHAAAALVALRGEPAATPPRRPLPRLPRARRQRHRPPRRQRPRAAVDAPPAPRAAASAGAFVDLGSMILDERSTRDTRMRIDRADPKGQDEQKEFQEILEQFKRGIEQNLDSEDYEAHYDLGIAFKEMGLLDEAIAEFQKALRSPEGRLRTSEALGICFYDKGQFAISETVLRRAVESVDGGDEAKIGLLYWLGRAAEAQGKEVEAITSYERALAVDIRFMDLSERVHRLAGGRSK